MQLNISSILLHGEKNYHQNLQWNQRNIAVKKILRREDVKNIKRIKNYFIPREEEKLSL